MRIMVLGGDGYLGWPTAMYLSAHGHTVSVLDNAVHVRPPPPLDEQAVDSGERFVTAALIDVPDDRPGLRVVNRGHPPPLLLHGGTVAEL